MANTLTENFGLAYTGTGMHNVDFFGLIDIYTNPSHCIDRFKKAYDENKKLAIKNLLYARDIQNGKGVRKNYKHCLKYLIKVADVKFIKELMKETMQNKSFRADDFHFILEEKESELKDYYIELIKEQIDSNNYAVIKWLPLKASKTNASRYKQSVALARGLGMTNKEYRHMVREKRSSYDIIERRIVTKNFNGIDYASIPGRAFLRYKNILTSGVNKERFKEYLESLKKGETKMNTSTITYPDIIHEVIDLINDGYYSGNYGLSEKEIKEKLDELEIILEKMDKFESKKNILVMADVSGSMLGGTKSKIKPLDVSISAAYITALNNKSEAYRNKFITFSEQPEIHEIKGDSLYERVKDISSAEWNMNTNMDAALRLILNLTVIGSANIDRLVIISDMEVDRCFRGGKKLETVIETFKREFGESRYKMPEIVFWNVNSKKTLISGNQDKMAIISGFTNSIFEAVLNGEELSPYEFMMDVLNKYEKNEYVHRLLNGVE